MHPDDGRILHCLGQYAPEYASLIATRVGMSPRYVGRRLAVLEQHGYVDRQPNSVLYQLTDQGSRYLEEPDVAIEGGSRRVD